MIQAKQFSKAFSSMVEQANFPATESYIDRILQKTAELDAPGKEHLESYLLHKWRMNHKPSTLKGSTHAMSSFLIFYAARGKRLEDIVLDDIEAFVERGGGVVEGPGGLDGGLGHTIAGHGVPDGLTHNFSVRSFVILGGMEIRTALSAW